MASAVEKYLAAAGIQSVYAVKKLNAEVFVQSDVAVAAAAEKCQKLVAAARKNCHVDLVKFAALVLLHVMILANFTPMR